MNKQSLYLLAADAVLMLHAAFVLFVAFGLILIYVGQWRGWDWVRNFWFRVIHLAAIGVVVAQAWLGVLCPLTVLEKHLRKQAGTTVYEGSFIGNWLDKVLYYDLPGWVFMVVYTAFGALVLASWFIVKPRKRKRSA